METCGRESGCSRKAQSCCLGSQHLRVQSGAHLQIVVVVLSGCMQQVLAVASACRLVTGAVGGLGEWGTSHAGRRGPEGRGEEKLSRPALHGLRWWQRLERARQWKADGKGEAAARGWFSSGAGLQC